MKKLAFAALMLVVIAPLGFAQDPTQGPFRSRRINNVRKCDAFLQGADFSAKVNACIADLPSTGGTADARGFEGAQTIGTTIDLTGKPVKLLLGAVTASVTAALGIDVGSKSSVIGIGSGTSDLTGAVTLLKAGANNVVLVRTNGTTTDGVTGTLMDNVRLEDFSADGNNGVYTRAQAFQLHGVARSHFKNISAFNCGAVTCVDLRMWIDSEWLGGSIIGGLGNGLDVSDNGVGAGTGNLHIRSLIIASNAGDGVNFQGGGEGQIFEGLDIFQNNGACFRAHNETSSSQAPQGWTFEKSTCESNGDAEAQVVIKGSATGQRVQHASLRNIVFNNANGPFTASPVAISIDRAMGIVIEKPHSFGGGAFLTMTPTATAITINDPDVTDTHFYDAGTTAHAFVRKSPNGEGALADFDLADEIADGTTFGIRGGGNTDAGGVLFSDSSNVAGINAVSNHGGSSTVINDNANAQWRLVTTTDWASFSRRLAADYLGNLTISNTNPLAESLNRRGIDISSDATSRAPALILDDTRASGGRIYSMEVGFTGAGIWALRDINGGANRITVDSSAKIGFNASSYFDNAGNLGIGGAPGNAALSRYGIHVQSDAVTAIPNVLIQDLNGSGGLPWSIEVGRSARGVFAIRGLGSSADRLTINDSTGLVSASNAFSAGTTVNAATGLRIGGAAPLNHVPIGDGNNYVDGIIGLASLGYTASGTGTVLALATSPALTTPDIGDATGTSLALTGVGRIDGVLTLNSQNVTLGPDTGRIGAAALRLQPASGNTDGYFTVKPIGSSNASGFRLYNTSSNTDTAAIDVNVVGTTAQIFSTAWGTGTAPTSFLFNGLAAAFGDANFNAAITSSNPTITFDSGTDNLTYVRASNEFDFNIAGTIYCLLNTTNLSCGAATFTGPVNTGTAFKVGGAVGTAGNVLRSNGSTGAVFAQLASSDLSDGTPNTRNINTTSPITGGGNLTADRTIACATCTTSAAALTSGQLIAGSGLQAMAVTNLTGDVTTSGGVATTLAHTYPQHFGTTTAPACTNGGGTNTFIGDGNSSTTETSVMAFIPAEAYVISKLYVTLGANVPASQTATLTIMDNTSAQTVTCSIAAGAASCNDTAHSFTTTAGHKVDIRLNCAGGTSALTVPVNIGIGLK